MRGGLYNPPNFLTNPTIQGTVLAGTGLTMPAFTMGGNITTPSDFLLTNETAYLRLNGNHLTLESVILYFSGRLISSTATNYLDTNNTTIGLLSLRGYGSGAYVEHARLAPNNWEMTNGKLTGALVCDAQNLSTDTTTGTKIGTGTTQKLGFWNATPVVQGGHIADAPAGGAGATAGAYDSAANRDLMIAAINNIIAALENVGIRAAA